MHSQVSENREDSVGTSLAEKLDNALFSDKEEPIDKFILIHIGKYKDDLKNPVEFKIVIRDLCLRYFKFYKDKKHADLIGPALYIDEVEFHRPTYLNNIFDSYVTSRIKQNFGLSITDVMKLTPLEYSFVLESAAVYNKDQSLAKEKMEAELRELTGDDDT